jgi:hypothetical protein
MVCIGVLVNALVVYVLKEAFGMTRPVCGIGHSFPSLSMQICAFLVVYFIYHFVRALKVSETKWRLCTRIFLGTAYIGLLGVSRVVLGYSAWEELVLSALIGGGFTMLYTLLLPRLIEQSSVSYQGKVD